MKFILDNGFKYELPKEKRILLFGANRTGKGCKNFLWVK